MSTESDLFARVDLALKKGKFRYAWNLLAEAANETTNQHRVRLIDKRMQRAESMARRDQRFMRHTARLG